MKRLKLLLLSLIVFSSTALTSCSVLDLFSSFTSSDTSYTLTLKTSSLEMKVGDEPVLIEYTLDPKPSTILGPSIEWASNNESAVTVSKKGYITPIGVGDAIITASLSADSTVKAYCTVSVFPNDDEGEISISLNARKQNVKQGETFQLSADVKNFKTTDEVTWSGSANGIAVSDDGLVSVSETAVLGATATIVATSVEDSSKSASCIITVSNEPNEQAKYTIMLYMCASTLEFDADNGGSSGLFSNDILEILSVQNIPDSINIIIETGGTKKWSMPSAALDGATSISNLKLQRWEVEPVSSSYSTTDPYFKTKVTCYNKLKLVETLETNKMSEQSSFESFLKWGLDYYYADKMGVIISGHGGGVDGCAYDDNNNSKGLNAAKIASACESALKTSQRDKFTWIGYDCCNMAGIDNASINADYFEYMVASQEIEYGTGYNHDVYLNELIKNPQISTESLLSVLAKAFVDENHKDCPYTHLGLKTYCYQTTSVIDLSKVDAIVNAFNAFSTNVTYAKAKTAFIGSSLNSFGESCYGLVDMNNFLTSYANKNSGVSVENIKNAVNNAVISNYYCSQYATVPCGLNLFFPESISRNYELQVEKANYTGNQTKLTTWQTMCLSNGSFYTGSGSGGYYWDW